MIEIASYRVCVRAPDYTQAELKDFLLMQARIQTHMLEIADFVRSCQDEYKAAGGVDPHLNINPQNNGLVLNLTSTDEFKKFLQGKNHAAIKAVEAPCGYQYMAFAAFVPCSHQTNVESYGTAKSLMASAFNQISYGIAPGKALTPEERTARETMHNALFDKISDEMTKLKNSHPDYKITVEEKQPGSFFIRVIPSVAKEYGVSSYDVNSVIGRLGNDKNIVGAMIAGPEIYPSDVLAMQAEQAKNAVLPRAPRKLDF